MYSLGMAGHWIRRLNQRSSAVFAAQTQAAGFDLSPVQFAALDAIAHHPGADQATVAQLIAYDRATMGGVIERLQQKGWISRAVSSRDRRARELALTASGQRVLAQLLPPVLALQEDILAALSAHERDTLLRLVRKAITDDAAP